MVISGIRSTRASGTPTTAAPRRAMRRMTRSSGATSRSSRKASNAAASSSLDTVAAMRTRNPSVLAITHPHNTRARARVLWGWVMASTEGFRVRIAATVSSDEEAAAFDAFLDERDVAPEERVIRRIALRGAAVVGVPLARVDLIPEITITADGFYWHPVGADDPDFFVTAKIFPLA